MLQISTFTKQHKNMPTNNLVAIQKFVVQGDSLLADFNGDKNLDILSYYPGSGNAVILQSNGQGNLTKVFDSNGYGIAGYDLRSASDRALAFDYNGDGKQDLFLYRPGRGAAWVARSNGDGSFTAVYAVGDDGAAGLNGIAGYDLLSGADQALAFDYNGDGKQDLFLYRPGRGAAWVARSNGDGSFTAVYAVGDDGAAGLNGIAGFDFLSGNDRALASDVNGDGKQDLIFYRGNQPGLRVAISNGDGSFTGANIENIFTGDNGNNNLVGGNGDDILTGNGGNDTVSGGNGNDTLVGGIGDDSLDGGANTDTADYSAIGQAITLKPTGVVTKGTAGTDQLVNVENIIGATGLTNIIDASTATGTATINANLATKSLVVNTGVIAFPTLTFGVTNFATVIGTANNDTLTGDDGNNTLIGNGGNDILTGNGGNDTVSGGTGNDAINGGLGSDTVDYSSFTEAITLLASGIVNKGSFGTDTIVGVETVIGATGQSNTIDASTGTATTTSLNVNLGNNSLIVNGLPSPINSITLNVQNFLNVYGTTQNDTITGNNLSNLLAGNAGNDTIQGNDGDDGLFGGDGNDSLLGGVGQDVLLGEFGNDFLFGEVGNDLLFGDDGNDQLYGGDGLDELYGGIGADSLYGGNDNDVLWGEDGNDILNGGNGNDIFVIARGSADIVQDFQDGFDRIGLGGGLLFSQLTISSLGTNTLIRSSGQILATLQNVSSTLITNTDFTVV
jgi:Ca2+-binding RTX toxin-like protein